MKQLFTMRFKTCKTMPFISKALMLMTLMLSLPGDTSAADHLPKLLLVTFDGLGWNMLSKEHLPSFKQFVDKGVHVRWVENVFPTVTRTNHMSLVSGLYSESHGIVENDFFDEKLKVAMPAVGQLKEEDSQWVDMGAEPVWVTNSKAGGGRRSGTVYWPCADAKIKGRMPDEIRRGEWSVNESMVSANARIDLALDWLTGKTESKQPVNFVAVYTVEPDEVSHQFGPDSQQVLDSIKTRDSIVKHLLEEIEKRKLQDELNVILTADHGHLPVYPETLINIDLMIDPLWYSAYPSADYKAMINVWPIEGHFDKIVHALESHKHLNLHVATNRDLRDLVKMHYAFSPRIAPIVLYTEPGWAIVSNSSTGVRKGMHGWDPRYCPQMWPFFMARGPAFKQGVEDAPPFHLVDVYPLMCEVLGLNPAPNNGSLSRAAHILLSHPSTTAGAAEDGQTGGDNYTWVAVGLLVTLLGVVVGVVVLRYVRNSKNVSAAYKRTFARAGTTEDMRDENMVIISDEEL